MPRINAEYRTEAKKKIVAATLEISARDGWDAVTLDAIAKEVGVTKGALYAYFENREALLREVILELFKKIRLGIESALEKSDDAHSVILNLADLIFEQQKPYATIFCQLPVRIPQDTKYREEFSRIFDGNRLLVRDCLARMKAEGKLSGDIDPEEASGAIIGLTMGLRIISLFLGKDNDEAKKTWISTVERILGVSGSGA